MQQHKPPSGGWGLICLSTAYLGTVEYYVALNCADKIFIEQHEHYVKQSYRNRCRIATPNGILDLSIPVEKTGKELIQDVRISEHSNWQTHHWRSIETAYNSSPFFEYYKDDLQPFYEIKWKYLWDFNMEIQLKVFELLDIEPKIEFTRNFELIGDNHILDFRNSIHPKNNANCILKPYYQVFEQKFGFISNLSIIDLLFNMGNESQLIIHN
ncbi:MAG: WbqC family protein [Paludibacter sp.]|nr:WbqC family protein [Paludibacter sp.]